MLDIAKYGNLWQTDKPKDNKQIFPWYIPGFPENSYK